jgi:hypothetical protein
MPSNVVTITTFEGKSMQVVDEEFYKILSMAITALGRLDDASPMEKRALTAALKLENL